MYANQRAYDCKLEHLRWRAVGWARPDHTPGLRLQAFSFPFTHAHFDHLPDGHTAADIHFLTPLLRLRISVNTYHTRQQCQQFR